jgi:hypothetical protein
MPAGTGPPLLLAAGGAHGIVRLIDPVGSAVPRLLLGHGQAVNMVKFDPSHPTWLFSASAGAWATLPRAWGTHAMRQITRPGCGTLPRWRVWPFSVANAATVTKS